MMEAELIKCLSERFYSDFADTVARRVRDAGAVGLLYEVVTSRYEGLPRAVRHKVAFRGAYVLEKIYFDAPDSFMPCAGKFCGTDFPACADPSARRHFAKVMADLLGRYSPGRRDMERIAEAAARWAVEPGAKVAVKIWAVEVLKHCRRRVGWVQEVWDDIVETMAHDATPGIEVRMRKTGGNPAGREPDFVHDMGNLLPGNVKARRTSAGFCMLQGLCPAHIFQVSMFL